jgi:hypothetical protein
MAQRRSSIDGLSDLAARQAKLQKRAVQCERAAKERAEHGEVQLARRLLMEHRAMFVEEHVKLVAFEESMARAKKIADAMPEEADRGVMAQMRASSIASVTSFPVLSLRNILADDLADHAERTATRKALLEAKRERGEAAAAAKRARFEALVQRGAECWQCAICSASAEQAEEGAEQAGAAPEHEAEENAKEQKAGPTDGVEKERSHVAAETPGDEAPGADATSSEATPSERASLLQCCRCCGASRDRSAIVLAERKAMSPALDYKFTDGEEAADWLRRTATIQLQPTLRSWLSKRALGRTIDERIEARLREVRLMHNVAVMQRRFRARMRARKWRHMLLMKRVGLRWRRMVQRGRLRRTLIYTRVWRGYCGRKAGNALRTIRDDKRVAEIHRNVMAVRLQRTFRRRQRRACAPLLSFWKTMVNRRKMVRVLARFVDAHLERNFRLARGTAAACSIQRWVRGIISERLHIRECAFRVVRALRSFRTRKILSRIRDAANTSLAARRAAQANARLVWKRGNPLFGESGHFIDAWQAKSEQALRAAYSKSRRRDEGFASSSDDEDVAASASAPVASNAALALQPLEPSPRGEQRRRSRSAAPPSPQQPQQRQPPPPPHAQSTPFSVATKVASASAAGALPPRERDSLFEYGRRTLARKNERPLNIPRAPPPTMTAPSPSAKYDRARHPFSFSAQQMGGAAMEMVDPRTLMRPSEVPAGCVDDPICHPRAVAKRAAKRRGKSSRSLRSRARRSKTTSERASGEWGESYDGMLGTGKSGVGNVRFSSVLRVKKVRGKIHTQTVDVKLGPPTAFGRLVCDDHTRMHSAQEWQRHEWEWGNSLRHATREVTAPPLESWNLLLGSAPPVPHKLVRASAALTSTPWHRAYAPVHSSSLTPVGLRRVSPFSASSPARHIPIRPQHSPALARSHPLTPRRRP